jgi:hypothetical protein
MTNEKIQSITDASELTEWFFSVRSDVERATILRRIDAISDEIAQETCDRSRATGNFDTAFDFAVARRHQSPRGGEDSQVSRVRARMAGGEL